MANSFEQDFEREAFRAMSAADFTDSGFFNYSFDAKAAKLDDEGRLTGIELVILFGGKPYALRVLTIDQHAEWAAQAPITDEEDPTYLIFESEIRAEDLIRIREASFDELRPHLVEVEQDDTAGHIFGNGSPLTSN